MCRIEVSRAYWEMSQIRNETRVQKSDDDVDWRLFYFNSFLK